MSASPRLSLIYPMQPAAPQQLEPFARTVKSTGLNRLWLGQSLAVDSLHAFSYLAGRGIRVPCGSGVSLTALRPPFDAANQARSAAVVTTKPFVAGFGPATPNLVSALRGEPYRRPARAAAEYASAVRRLLDGEVVELDGEAGTLAAQLTPLAHPRVEVGLGVLRPGMAALAGGVADVAITWMTPADYVRDTLLPALDKGALAHGREHAPRVATVVHTAIARRGRDAHQFALTGAGTHLSTPHYTDMLRQAGVPAHADSPSDGARELLDRGVYLYGTAEEIAKGVLDYWRAGVDEVILNTAGAVQLEGPQAAVKDAQEIAAAVEDARG